MRSRFVGTLLTRFLGLTVLLMSAAALHAQGVQQKIEFYLDGKVGTELVKRGSYTIVYPETEQGTLEIKVGKKIISVPFVRQIITEPSDADKTSYRDNPDGSRSIASITPRGKRFTLVLQ